MSNEEKSMESKGKEKDDFFEIERTFLGHSSNIYSILYFSDQKRLVSSSHDKTIKIWDAKNGECIKTLHEHARWVNDLQKKDESTFVSCCSGGMICIYSIESMSNIKVVRNDSETHDYIRLMMISRNRILVFLYMKHEPMIVNLQTCEIERKLKSVRCHYLTKIPTSINHENCIYVNCSDMGEHQNPVHLVNYMKDEVPMSFTLHNQEVYIVEPFLDKRKVEMLILGGGIFDKTVENENRDRYNLVVYDTILNKIVKMISTETGRSCSSYVFRNKDNCLLFVGDLGEGTITSFDLNKFMLVDDEEDSEDTGSYIVMGKKEVHENNGVSQIILMDYSITNDRENQIRLITSSFDKSICQVRFSGILRGNEMDRRDLSERISYLRVLMEESVDEDEDQVLGSERCPLVGMKIKNRCEWKVMKLLFL